MRRSYEGPTQTKREDQVKKDATPTQTIIAVVIVIAVIVAIGYLALRGDDAEEAETVAPDPGFVDAATTGQPKTGEGPGFQHQPDPAE